MVIRSAGIPANAKCRSLFFYFLTIVWGMREAGREGKKLLFYSVSLNRLSVYNSGICSSKIQCLRFVWDASELMHSLVRQTSLCLSPKTGKFTFCSTQTQRFRLMERQMTGIRTSTNFSDKKCKGTEFISENSRL